MVSPLPVLQSVQAGAVSAHYTAFHLMQDYRHFVPLA
jgi:hypothetical protein